MKQHVTVVGALQIGLSLLSLVAGVIVGVVLVGIAVFLVPTQGGGEEAIPVLLGVGLGVGGFLVILSLPGILGGWGLLRYQPWARILVIIVAIIELFNVPLGTAVGAYSLWVLFQEETERLFAEPPVS